MDTLPREEEIVRSPWSSGLTQQTEAAVRWLCDHLTERTASLFLGPGVNDDVVDADGERFPQERRLSDMICARLLDSPGLAMTLEEATEIARHRLGSKEVDAFLYEAISHYPPGPAHRLVCQLPWDVIYTTNVDVLLEEASGIRAIGPVGTIRPIWSLQEDVSALEEADVPYYKLHGSADHANTASGQLILTREDEEYYALHRKPLLQRLRRELSSRCFVFLGYSLNDAKLRKILQDCKDELGVTSFPLSYVVVEEAHSVAESFWRERFNVQVVRSGTIDFLLALKDAWDAQGCQIASLEARRDKRYLTLGEFTSFAKVGGSYYEVRKANCAGKSDPKRFFRGGEPTWPDVRDEVPPLRDLVWTVLDAVLEDVDAAGQQTSSYLVTGAAGSGKTTAARQLLWLLAKDFADHVRCLEHIPSTPLDVRPLGQLIDPRSPKRLVILVRNAADYGPHAAQFLHDIRAQRLPVTVIFEERRNQWSAAMGSGKRATVSREFELEQLSVDEIEAILNALDTHGSLGKLVGVPFEQQVEHFAILAHKELLVALRELTSEGTFDDIVRDEFRRIPSDVARKAYVYTSAVGQVGLAIRYETILRLLKIRYDEARRAIFVPTEGVLISHSDAGHSRHNVGYQLRARHPTIASVIFDTAAPSDDEKFAVFNELLSELDPGYPEDWKLLQQMVFRRELLSTIASPERRRAIFDRLAAILPNNASVLQHRSILERELNDAARAIQYAKDALRVEPHNPTMLNTLGLAYERAARAATSDVQRRSYLAHAARLFDDGVRRDPTNAYGWIGKAALIKADIEAEKDAARRAMLRTSAIAMLEEALELTDDAPLIAGELAEQRSRIGESDQAIDLLTNALKVKPADSRLRDQLVRVLRARKQLHEALRAASTGVNLDPTAWRLHYHIAAIRRSLDDNVDAVVASYRAALRYRQSDVRLRVELGAYLFMTGRYDESKQVFRELQSASGDRAKRDVTEAWRDDRGHERIFTGKVASLSGSVGNVLAVPENFEAMFWRTGAAVSNLRPGDRVRFRVTFSIRGPLARIVS